MPRQCVLDDVLGASHIPANNTALQEHPYEDADPPTASHMIPQRVSSYGRRIRTPPRFNDFV